MSPFSNVRLAISAQLWAKSIMSIMSNKTGSRGYIGKKKNYFSQRFGPELRRVVKWNCSTLGIIFMPFFPRQNPHRLLHPHHMHNIRQRMLFWVPESYWNISSFSFALTDKCPAHVPFRMRFEWLPQLDYGNILRCRNENKFHWTLCSHSKPIKFYDYRHLTTKASYAQYEKK